MKLSRREWVFGILFVTAIVAASFAFPSVGCATALGALAGAVGRDARRGMLITAALCLVSAACGVLVVGWR